MLFASVINCAFLVVFESRQKVNFFFIEPLHELVAVFVENKLVRVPQGTDIVASGEFFCLGALQVASEIHVTEDELVVLLSALELVVDAWDHRLGLVCIKEICSAAVVLADVVEALLVFALA